MITLQKKTCIGLLLTIVAIASPLRASDDGRDLALKINSANGLLRSGNVESAINAYRQAQDLGPNSADLSYNMAVAQYRKGDVSKAEHLFQAAATAENDSLAAKARYNVGNCKFASALRDAEKDRPTAIKGFESAITSYRSALDIDPSDADARANIERAAALIEKLRNEDRKEQQQQNDQQKQKHDEKQDNKQQQKSQQSNSQKQENQKQQGTDKKQSQDQQQRQQSQSPSQSDSKDKQSAANQQPPTGDKAKDANSAQDKPQQQSQHDPAQKDQQQDSKSPEQSRPQQDKHNAESQSASTPKQQDTKTGQPQSQQNRQQRSANQPAEPTSNTSPDQPSDQQGKTPPKGALTAAGNDNAKDDKSLEQVPALDAAKDGEMTTQEAQKMLQSIRDRDMIRRLQRQAAERDRHVPVDRDW